MNLGNIDMARQDDVALSIARAPACARVDIDSPALRRILRRPGDPPAPPMPIGDSRPPPRINAAGMTPERAAALFFSLPPPPSPRSRAPRGWAWILWSGPRGRPVPIFRQRPRRLLGYCSAGDAWTSDPNIFSSTR